MAQEEEADDEELFDVRSPASPGSDAAPQTDRDDNIRVFVRVRPPNVREDLAHLRDSIVVDTASGMVQCLEPPRRFAFDGVLGHDSPQEEVFELLGQRVAEHTLSGYNGSIYVYGQTGSGKTYTMQGAVDSVQSMHHEDKRGLMCRILDYIFAEISRRHVDGSVQHSCKCSYLEIYKEQITDLLEPSASNLQIREDTNRGVYVERLSEHSVWSSSDAFHVVWKGLHQRHVAATQMNELSSRSHAVFTLKLEASSTTAGGVTSTKVSRLNLIDLAGSERQSFDHSSPHESLRVKEAGAINRSLSALTNVIMSLSHRRKPSSAGPQRQPFVRYRDSKLTFLLRDSLGGNSKTVIVGCVSPSALCFGETLSTLKFAARAKHIRCSAVMNEEYSGTVESLMLEVRSLRQQLDLLSSRGLLAEGEAHGKSSQCASKGQRLREEELALEALVAETLDAAGTREDLQSLYGPRRVRRLEILLAAVLERERRCELRRHKMDKYSQYLNTTLERKEQYFDALRSYFSGLVDYAAGEACYLPEFTARLVLFRQQLANAQAVEGRQSEMLAGTIEAFLVAEEGLLNDGNGRDESPSGLCYVSTQNLLEHEQSTRSRSYSYGYLLGEAARRSGRRSTSHMKQLASSSMARLPGAMAIEESSALGEGTGGPVEAELAELRAENKLLRRQLESHPELYRLSAENRLLREHMAMLVQQKASHQEPDFYRNREMKEHRPEKEMSLARTTSRLLSTEKEEPTVVEGGSRFELKHFPGIEEVTRLSSSGSESELEAPREDRGSGEVTSFLPAMARQVQELFRVKDAMEESLRQHLRARRSRGAGARDGRFIRVSSRGEREVPVDAAALAEALQGATQALQNAEAMVAKGSCGDLFVGIDEGGVLGDRVCSEGMDERDVFLSLMRSLPGESHALRREGVLASSVPQLPRPGIPSRCRSGSLESSSTGGGCLQRMKSTMQLHRIVEAPSLQEIEIESPARQGGGRDPPGGGDEEPADTPGDRLQLTIQQVQNLSKQLESIGEIHKEVKSQLEPMQQEYLRRLEEVRFLEAQCRRLDVHCRRLEELTVAAVRTPRERREGTGTPRAVRTSGWCQATLPAAQAAAPAAAQPMVASGGRFIPVASRSAAQTVAVVYDTQGLPQRSASWTMLPTRTAAPKQGSLQNLRHEAAQAADAPVLFSPSQEMLRRVYSAPQLQVSTERMFQSRVEGHVSSRHYGGARAEDPEAIRPPGFGWAGPDARQGLPTGAAFVTRFEATRGRAP